MNQYNHDKLENGKLARYLKEHNSKANPAVTVETTHTRIGDKAYEIYGGAYHIADSELPGFYTLYYNHIFIKNQREYLTEKQLIDNGAILVDFDFRYDSTNITTRQHNLEHIQDMIQIYLDEIKALIQFEANVKFPIFIMEKPNPNILNDGSNITKDGIHMIIGIQMNRVLQWALRSRVLKKLEIAWGDLSLTNTYESVLDDGITKGSTNWQLFGSRKPGNEAYQLITHLTVEYDDRDNDFMMKNEVITSPPLKDNFYLITARFDKHPCFQINPKFKKEYETLCAQKSAPKKRIVLSRPVSRESLENSSEKEADIASICDAKSLENAVNYLMESLKPDEYAIKETHAYTQILPLKYYEPGSHLLNRQVAFALKHTDERLFLSWVMLRSKASDFDYGTIPDLYKAWGNFKNRSDGITRRSIIYWAKQDAFDEYVVVRKSTSDYFIEATLTDATDFDFAQVLHYMFKDKYICANVSQRAVWYIFKSHRWEIDEGATLRLAISKVMYNCYQELSAKYIKELQNYETNTPDEIALQKKIKSISRISCRLKTTSDKNNIMREAAELFYDKDFEKNLDSNPYLLGFTNGVVDFSTNTFRSGYPHDYLSKSTGREYIVPSDRESDENVQNMKEINKFFDQAFPLPNLRRYMWEKLAAVLIGEKQDESFDIYFGSGSNGKSKLTKLMFKALGDYATVVPLSLLTDKRPSIGGTSSEVYALKGVRYAVSQEPSAGVIMNDGIVKELTGGDPLQARTLYKESEVFVPQFSLCVCTNTKIEWLTDNDGIWRRIKEIVFMSKFYSEGEKYHDKPRFEFPKDVTIDSKIPKWASLFVSMLVSIAFQTGGKVTPCTEVTQASNEYRQEQDVISTFITEKIEVKDGSEIKPATLTQEFKAWHYNTYGHQKGPKVSDLTKKMDAAFGKRQLRSTWKNVALIFDDTDDIG
jgi:P4 family phage/plasmid primase-like protien